MCTSIRKSLNSCIRFIDWCIKNPFHSKEKWCKLHFLKLTEHGLKPLECHYAQIKICCLTFHCSGFNQCYSLGCLCKNQAQNTVFFPMKWHRKQWGRMHKQCKGPFRYNPTLKIVLFFFLYMMLGLAFQPSFTDLTVLFPMLQANVPTPALPKLGRVVLIYISFLKTISRDYFHHLCSSTYL